MMKVTGEIGALTDSCENHADDESQRVGDGVAYYVFTG